MKKTNEDPGNFTETGIPNFLCDVPRKGSISAFQL